MKKKSNATSIGKLGLWESYVSLIPVPWYVNRAN